MNDVLADTHSILWYLFEARRLSAAAGAALSGAVQSGGLIRVSAITPVEVCYLVEKGKIPAQYWTGLLAALLDSNTPVNPLPVDHAVAQAVEQIPRNTVPDMPDRIIAATAIVHGLSLVTCDPKIQASSVPTIW